MNATSYLLFAACAPGVEPHLHKECEKLGFSAVKKVGGVELRTGAEGLYRLCMSSRLAESVRVRLRPFVARDFETLEENLARLPWRAYLRTGEQVEVRAVCQRSRLWHSGAVEERTARVLGERLGAISSAAAGQPARKVFVRIEKDSVQVSVEAAGRLHQRGYRTHVDQASVRETLAAVLFQVVQERAGGSAPEVIWDPFCGAGTILCEAGRALLGIAPGSARGFEFESWPSWGELGQLREQVLASLAQSQREYSIRLWGSDVASRALDAATQNAARAQIGEMCEWVQGDFEKVAERIPQGAWVLSNPPYGERLPQTGWVRRFVQLLERRRDLRPCGLLLGGAARQALPPSFRSLLQTKNGGIPVSVRYWGE